MSRQKAQALETAVIVSEVVLQHAGGEIYRSIAATACRRSHHLLPSEETACSFYNNFNRIAFCALHRFCIRDLLLSTIYDHTGNHART